MNIYIGNLPYGVDEDELMALFAEHGQVSRSTVVKDRETGQSKGFGFIEMANDDEAEAAIDKLNGHSVKGRSIKVSEAKPKSDKPPRR